MEQNPLLPFIIIIMNSSMVHDPKPSLRHRAHYKMMKKKGSVEVDAVDGQHA